MEDRVISDFLEPKRKRKPAEHSASDTGQLTYVKDPLRSSVGHFRKGNKSDGKLSTLLFSLLTHGCGSAMLGDRFLWT